MEKCGCYRLCENFGLALGGNLCPFFALSLPPPPFFFFFWGGGSGEINFTTILWFFWNLVFMLFDSPNDLVFGGFLFFTNISGFLEVNCPQKFTFDFTLKFNFGYIPLEHICGIKARKLPKKGYFMDAESVR